MPKKPAEVVNNAKLEFEKYLKKHVVKNNRYMNGIDVGCGTARIDDMILSIDEQPEYQYAHAQIVHNCKDLNIFSDDSLDFIFSSHCLEDFSDIPGVIHNWFSKLKPDGLLLLLLPDMEGGRYAKVEDPTGNPSHKTNVGKNFIIGVLEKLKEAGKIKYEILQMDTIPHNESPSIDFVIKKLGR